jgi:5-methylcytosine-specific restriction endonuclease McrA
MRLRASSTEPSRGLAKCGKEPSPQVRVRQVGELDRSHEVHPVARAAGGHVEALLEHVAGKRAAVGGVHDHRQEHDVALAALKHRASPHSNRRRRSSIASTRDRTTVSMYCAWSGPSSETTPSVLPANCRIGDDGLDLVGNRLRLLAVDVAGGREHRWERRCRPAAGRGARRPWECAAAG